MIINAHKISTLVAKSASHARTVLVITLTLAVLLAVYTANNLAINTDTDQMIDPNLPFRQNYDAFQKAFPDLGNTFFILIESPTPEKVREASSQVLALLQKQKSIASTFSPGMGAFFDQNGLLFLTIEELESLSNRLAETQPLLSTLAAEQNLNAFLELIEDAIEDARETGEIDPSFLTLLNDMAYAAETGTPLSWQGLLEKERQDESTRQVIIVQPKLDFSRLQPAKPALEATRQISNDIERAMEGVEIRLSGKMALAAEEIESVTKGASWAGILSLLLVSTILGFGVRRWQIVIATITTLTIGLIFTTAFAVFAIGYFNMISVAFAVLFIGLGIDFSIHFSLRAQEEGNDHEALVKAGKGTGPALLLSSLTTAVAFLAFAPTAYVGLAQLGVISAAGIAISFITSLTLLPAILSLLPAIKPMRKESAASHLAEYVDRHSLPILIGTFVMMLISLWLARQVTFDFDTLRLKDPNAQSVQAFNDLLSSSRLSPYAAAITTKDQAEARKLASSIKEDPLVARVIWRDSFIPENQEEKLDILASTSLFMTPVFFALPSSEQDNPQEAFENFSDLLSSGQTRGEDLDDALARLATAIQPYVKNAETLETLWLYYFSEAIDRLALSLNAEPVTGNTLPQELRQRYEAEDGTLRLEIFPDIPLNNQQALTDFVTSLEATYPDVTGSPVQIVKAGQIVKNAMLEATLLAGILIAVLLIIVFRAFKPTILVLVPVLLAGIVTAGLMVLTGQPFNFANVIVLPLLIGVGVDSGIHMVHRTMEGHKNSKILVTSTPRAIMLAALTTTASFGTLMVSPHKGMASMGIVLTFALISILFAMLVVLPALLHFIYKQEPGKP